MADDPKYPLSEATARDLAKRFTPKSYNDEEAQARAARICGNTQSLAELMAMNVPPGRELSLALTKLEEAQTWAMVGIAHEG
jgi:hypothetical protein